MIEQTQFVIDGDTTYGRDTDKRRLHGIDTPEISHTDTDFTMAGGNEAAVRLGALLTENPDAVWESISYDAKYGRDVGRYVTRDGKDLNEQLVREGYASTLDFGGKRSPYHQAELEYTKDLDADKDVYAATGTYVPYEDREENLSLAQEFGEGVARGIDQTQGLLGYGISALARSVGMDGMSDYGIEVAERNFAEAQKHAATVSSYKDVNFDDGILQGLSKGAHYITGIFGEQIPQIGFDIAAALVTGGLGAAGTSAVRAGINKGVTGLIAKSTAKSNKNVGFFGSMSVQQIGEVEAELRSNGVDAPLTSIVGGLGAGAVDFLGAKVLMKTASNFYKKGKGLHANEVLVGGLKNTALEGSTEGIQTVIAKAAVLHEKTGYDMFSDDNIEEIINSMIAGAIVGSAPSVAATGASFVRKGINKISGDVIEKQNQEIIGAEQTRSEVLEEAKVEGIPPEDIQAVTTTAVNADGDKVELGQEVVSKRNVNKVTKKFEDAAATAGFTDITTVVASANATVTERAGKISEDGDHFVESIEQVESQFLAFKDGGKNVVYTQPSGFKHLIDKFPKIIKAQDLYAVTDQGGNAVIVRGKVQAEAISQTLEGRQPEIHKMSDFLEETHDQIKETKDNGVTAVAFDVDAGGVADTQQKADVVQQAITPELEPTKSKEPSTFSNVDDKPQTEDVISDEVIAANLKREQEKAGQFEVDSVGVPIAPRKKLTGIQKLAKKEQGIEDKNEAIKKLNAVTESDADNDVIDSIDVSGNSMDDIRDKFLTDVSVLGLESYAQRAGMDAENLATALESMVAKPHTTEATKAAVSGAISEYRKAFPKDNKSETPLGKEVTVDSKFLDDDAEFINILKAVSSLENPLDNLFYKAISSGVSSAKALLRKRKIRYTNLKDFKVAGFKSMKSFSIAKNIEASSPTYGGTASDSSNDMVLWVRRTVDTDTGEVLDGRLTPIYIPISMLEMNKGGFRYELGGEDTNYAARMEDQLTEFLGFLADKGYVPEKFPDANDHKMDIALRPSHSSTSRPFRMKELHSKAKRTTRNNDSAVPYIDSLEERHAETEQAALLEVDVAEASFIDALASATDNAKDPTQKNTQRLLGTQIKIRKKVVKKRRAAYNKLVATNEEEVAAYEDKKANVGETIANNQSVDSEVEGGNTSIEVDDPSRKSKSPAPSTGKPKSKVKYSPEKTIKKHAETIMDKAGIVTDASITFNSQMDAIAKVTIAKHTGITTLHLNSRLLTAMQKDNPDAYWHVLAHEVGHVFVAETMHNVPTSVLAILHADFKKERARKPVGHPYRRGKGAGFDEWLSDQFALAVNTDRITAKTKKKHTRGYNSFVEEVVRVLRKIADTLSPFFGIDRLGKSIAGQAFMESMFSAGIENKTTADSEFMDSLASMNLEFGGTRPRSRAEERRFYVENKALGRKVDNLAEAKEDRDFTLGQNLNKTSDLGRAAINAVGQVGKSVITDPKYIPKQASRLVNSVRKGAPMFFTAANELKHMAGGKVIAKKYRNMFDSTVADSALWQNDAIHAFSKVPEAKIASFTDGTGSIPKELSTFMDKFHTFLSRNMPTLGYIKGYFPRAYDVQYIETNREAFELFLLDKAKAAGVKGFDKISASNAVDNILQDSSAFTGMPEEQADVFGNDPFSQKTRVLEFVTDEDLRGGGFLRKDVDNVLLSYVHRMAHRANFEKQFSGFSPLVGSNSSDKKAKAAFARKLFLGLPFRNEEGRLLSYDEKVEEFGRADEEFFQRNRKRFSEANTKKWIRKASTVKSSAGKVSTWEYYDKNQILRKTYSQISNVNDKHRFLKIVDALEGRLGADSLSPKVRNAMSTALAYQNWTILLYSGFSQLAEVSGLIFRNRDMGGAFVALKEIGNLIAGEGAKERRALYADMGFAQKQLTNQAILEGMGINYQSPFAQKINSVLFKMNGMNFVTNGSRIMGAAIAEKFIQRHAKKAANSNARSERYLSELGLTQEQAEYANSVNYKPYSEFVASGDITSTDALKSEAVHKAMFKFVDSAVVRPNATQRPVWGSDPRWMMVWHLKSFMYAYGSTILGGLHSEVSARYKESGSTLDAAVPLLVYAIPLLMMTGLSLELREFIQYRIFGLGSRPYSDGIHGADYVMELISRGGALGPMEMGYSFIEDENKGRSSLVGLMGPTAQQLSIILEMDLSKTINRSTPVLSQNPAFKEWVQSIL